MGKSKLILLAFMIQIFMFVSCNSKPSVTNAAFENEKDFFNNDISNQKNLENNKLSEDLNYSVIKRNHPYYILIFTPNRLNKKEIIKIYDEFKDSYENVRFTISRDPEEDDYLSVQSDYVFDFDKNAMYKLKDYLNDKEVNLME